MNTIGEYSVQEQTEGSEGSDGIDGITKGTCWMIDRGIKCVPTRNQSKIDAFPS